MNWPIHQIILKVFFLNDDLHEEIYMYQPPSFVKKDSENLVSKLNFFNLWSPTIT